MASYTQMIGQITPEIYQNLKCSLELGKWPNGIALTQEQKESCLQAIIAWEAKNLPENERTGFINGAGCKSQDNTKAEDGGIIKTKQIH